MEEMTLREAIEVLIKRKKLIIAVPILFMLASYIFLKLFAVPIYEAESVISISGEYYDDMINSKATDTNIYLAENNIKFIDNLMDYPKLGVNGLKKMFQDHNLLSEVYNDLSVKDNITVSQISNMIQISNAEDIFTISIRDKDPKRAAEIANLLTEKFNSYFNDYNRKSIQVLINYADNVIEKKSKDIEESSREIETLENKEENTDVAKARLAISKKIYEALLFKKEQLEMIEAIEFGSRSVIVLKHASIPNKAVAPDIKLIVLLSTSTGFVLSILTTYFLEYWRNSALKTEA